MPRVNRDLQRRLDARRERERRPATVQRYRFTPAAPGEARADSVATPASEAAATSALATPRALRAATARPMPRPYTSYGPDYAYVLGDLRRLALIVGVLLLCLIVLSLVAHL